MSDPQEPQGLGKAREPSVTRRVIGNHVDDLILRQTEQELRKRELEITREYSLKLLEAEFLDRQRDREHQRTTNITAGVLVAFLSLLLSAGICYALHLNKDQLVMEFVKAILFIVTGGVGGYSLKTVRDKVEAPKQ